MPGPGGHGGPGGRSFAKPKNTKAAALRMLRYLSRSKLPLIVVFICLLLSVGALSSTTWWAEPFRGPETC